MRAPLIVVDQQTVVHENRCTYSSNDCSQTGSAVAFFKALVSHSYPSKSTTHRKLLAGSARSLAEHTVLW